MPQVVLRLLPLRDRTVERPADALVDKDIAWEELTPIDHDWPEWGIESFIATYASAVLACLGEPCESPVVLRQVNDIDLVLVDPPRKTATLLELKKQDAPGPMDAVCQLAYNLAKARRILFQVFPGHSVRTVVCGSWRDGQLARVRDTVAWKYLKERGTSPSAVVYTGAISQNGSRYFLLSDRVLPFSRKGKTAQTAPAMELNALRKRLNGELPSGLGLAIYHRFPGVVIRFTADSNLRTKHLKSRSAAPPAGSLATFLAVQGALAGRQDLSTERLIGQRLELRIDLTPDQEDETRFYPRVHSVLLEIARLAIDSHNPAA